MVQTSSADVLGKSRNCVNCNGERKEFFCFTELIVTFLQQGELDRLQTEQASVKKLRFHLQSATF